MFCYCWIIQFDTSCFRNQLRSQCFLQISKKSEYAIAKQWIRNIKKQAVVVSEDWLKKYKEATPAGVGAKKKSGKGRQVGMPLVAFKLPKPAGTKKCIDNRRKQLAEYKKRSADLIRLFRSCAAGEISSAQFYEQLPKYWSNEIGDRLQGAGWERQGRDSDFQALSKSYIRILEAEIEYRDDIVTEEIDMLHKQRVETRKFYLRCFAFSFQKNTQC